MSSTLPVNAEVLSSFKPAKRFNHHNEASITSIDFDDSGQFLISAGVDKSIQLYDVYKGKHVTSIPSQKYGAHLAKFTHSDKSCLYASAPTETASVAEVDNSIRYLSLANKTYLRYFKGHKEAVLSLEVDPVHEFFLTSSMDRSVKMWDIRTSSATGSIDVGAPSVVGYDPMAVVFAVVKFPDFQTANDKEAKLELYDVANCDKKPFLKSSFSISSSGPIRCTKVEFSNNGKHILVSTSRDHYVIDAFTGELCHMIPGENRSNIKYLSNGSSTFSPDGNYIIVGGTRTVSLYDLNNDDKHIISKSSSKWLQPIEKMQGDGMSKIVVFNPKLLTFATADTIINLWQPSIE